MGTAAAFESLASSYDRDFGENPVGRRMRQQVWKELLSRLPAPGSVLDLGCGTGIDACVLVARGHRVVAVDGAAAMLRELQRKREQLALDGALELVQIDLNDREARRRLFSRIDVDAVLADFGVLNCVEELGGLAEELGEKLLPGGLMVASVMGKLSAWEVAYHLVRGRPLRALARLGRGPVPVRVGEKSILVRYYRPARFCAIFSPWFRTLLVRGLGSLLPPPYLALRLSSPEKTLDRLAALEERLGRFWPIRSLGDHFLVVLERK